MNELGKIAELGLEVTKLDGARQMTIDLSDRPIFLALKAIGEQAALSKPFFFSITLRGSDKKMILMPVNKSH
jgi:hypothetical protein